MSCICPSPVRPSFKDSYKDLLDKPSINGTIINGNIETDNLGIKYPTLINKPSINGVTLDGALTAEDLGIKAGAQFKIVPQLPATDIDEATVYLVPVQVGQTDNIYQEWIFINDKWEKIGEPINIQSSEQSVKTLNANVDISAFKESGPYEYDLTYVSNWPDSIALSDGLYISNCFGDPTSGSTGLHIRLDSTAYYSFISDGAFGVGGSIANEIPGVEWCQFAGLIYVANRRVTMDGTWVWL